VLKVALALYYKARRTCTDMANVYCVCVCVCARLGESRRRVLLQLKDPGQNAGARLKFKWALMLPFCSLTSDHSQHSAGRREDFLKRIKKEKERSRFHPRRVPSLTTSLHQTDFCFLIKELHLKSATIKVSLLLQGFPFRLIDLHRSLSSIGLLSATLLCAVYFL